MANDDWLMVRAQMIEQNLVRMKDLYPELTRRYPSWKVRRMLSLEMIEQLQEKLNTVYQAASVASGLGSVTCIAGVVGTIVGSVLAMQGNPSAVQWLGFGSKAQVAGGIIIPVALLAETGLSKYFLREFNDIMREDQAASEALFTWLTYSRDLDRSVREAFGCSVFSDMWNDVKSAFQELVRLVSVANLETRTAYETVRNMLQGKLPAEDLARVLECFGRIIREVAQSTGRGLLRSLQRLSELFQLPLVRTGLMGIKLYFGAYQLGNLLGLTQAEFVRNQCATGCGAGFYYAFEALSIGVHLLNVVESYRGFYSGESEYSKKLQKIKTELKGEITIVDNFILRFEQR